MSHNSIRIEYRNRKRDEAIAKGEKRFDAGPDYVCRKNPAHGSIRWTSPSYQCFQCSKEYQKEYADRNRLNKKRNYKKHKEKIIAYVKQYSLKNKKKIAARRKGYNAQNREKLNAYSRDYYKKNSEQIAGYGKKYRENNAESVAARLKRYREANPEKFTAWAAERRAAESTRTPTGTTDVQRSIIRAIYKRRLTLGERSGIPYHVDHRLPLMHPERPGNHSIYNLRIISESDNLRKWSKLDAECDFEIVEIDIEDLLERCPDYAAATPEERHARSLYIKPRHEVREPFFMPGFRASSVGQSYLPR